MYCYKPQEVCNLLLLTICLEQIFILPVDLSCWRSAQVMHTPDYTTDEKSNLKKLKRPNHLVNYLKIV